MSYTIGNATVCYSDVFQITLKHARIYLKTLSDIEKRLQRMESVEGRPLTFGDEVNRFARAIGAEGLIFWTGTHSHYREDEYREITLGEIPSHVNYIVSKLFSKEKENAA